MRSDMNQRNVRQGTAMMGPGRYGYDGGMNKGLYGDRASVERDLYSRSFGRGRSIYPYGKNSGGNGWSAMTRNHVGRSCPLSNRQVRKDGCGCGHHNARYEENVPAMERVDSLPQINNGCGCGCESGCGDRDCAKLLKQIQTVDFALYEVILYLDAYPESCEALNTYHMLMERKKKLVAGYEETCGPLTAHGNVSTTSWDWVKGPAPWEYPKD